MAPLPSIAGDIPLDQAGQLGGTTPPAVAPLSFFDKVKLGYREGGSADDWGWNQHNIEVDAYHGIRQALEAKGYQLPQTPLLSSGDEADFYGAGYHPTRPWLVGPRAQERFDAFWSAFNDARSKDPNFAPAYKDVHDFGTLIGHLHDQRNAVLGDVAARAPDGLGIGGFVGELGRGALDPMSWIPLAGPEVEAATTGVRILASALWGAAINAGVTTGLEPFVQRDAAALGHHRTVGDFLTGLFASSALGAAIGGGHEAIKLTGPGIRAGSFAGAARQADADAFGKALGRAINRADMPAGSPSAGFDATAARAFSEAVPREQRTPDEQAAIDSVERAAEVKSASPFVPGPAGDDAHGQTLDRAMHAVSNPDMQVPRGPVKPVARETVTAPEDVAGARFPARELLKAKIHAAEGDGPNRAGGSAFGPYQFEPRTWVNLFKRRYPTDGRSFDEIAALRGDPHLNDVLINDLISENAAALRHARFEETGGNLYLAHVLGHDRAVTLLRADPNARLGDLLPENYFTHGNPFRRDDSAASLVRWAYRKMGDEAGTPAHIAAAEGSAEGAEAIGAGEGDPAVETATGRFDVEALYGDVGMTDRPVLNPELFGSPEEHAAAQLRFERAGDAAEGFAPVMSRAEAFAPVEHFDAVRRYRGTVTVDAMGEALGLRPDEVRRVVQSMQSVDRRSPFILARERGAEPGDLPTRIMRRPSQVKSLIQFLAERGGINDAGGELKAMDVDVGRRFRKPLINNEPGRNGGMGLDDALSLAIEHDYFPELMAAGETYETKPDTQVLLDAIEAELRGEKKLPVDQQLDVAEARRRARAAPEERVQPEAPPRMTPEEIAAEIEPEQLAAWHGLARDRGLELSDAEAIEAHDRFYYGQVGSVDDALAETIAAAAARDAEEFAALSGETGYEASDELATYIGEVAEIRGTDGAFGEDGPGNGRSALAEGGAGESRAALAAAAHDPEKREYGDPVGPAAEAQADSTIHDLEMAVHGSTIRELLDRKDRLGLRQRWLGEQERALGREAAMEKLRAAELDDREPWLDPDFLLKVYSDDPEGSAAILEAIAEHGELRKVSYRLDEEGGESDLASILDEIDEAQKAAAEMRNCLKPKGGDE